MKEGTRNQTENGMKQGDDSSLQALFEYASARPAAPDEDREQVRESVYREWQAVAGKRRSRRRVAGFALAAAAVLVVTLMLIPAPETTPDLAPVQVARVGKATGDVRVMASLTARSSEVLAGDMPVTDGQIIRTGLQSGVALDLAIGISLRVDENTEIVMLSDRLVKLNSGRVYVDTQAGSPPDRRRNAENAFEIVTARGAVRHIGTQYIVRMAPGEFQVRVRDGSVQVLDSPRTGPDPLFVLRGQGLIIGEAGEKEIITIDSHGQDWEWAESLGAGFDLEGRTMTEFLDWVASETGLALEYGTPQARSEADNTILHGKIELPARQALDVVLMSSDLSATIDAGMIEISLNP